MAAIEDVNKIQDFLESEGYTYKETWQDDETHQDENIAVYSIQWVKPGIAVRIEINDGT